MFWLLPNANERSDQLRPTFAKFSYKQPLLNK